MSTLQSDSASSLFIGTAREQGETENDWKKVVANVTVGATELSETGTNTATTLYTDTIVTADDYLCIDNGTDTLIRAKADSVSSTGDTWDVSGASYYNKYFSIGSQDTTLRGSFFKPDGSKLYIAGGSNDNIYQYSLSTAWDVSTSSYDNKSFSIGSQDKYPYGLFFKPDGSKLYIVGYSSKTIYQYSLSTAWDVSTSSYDNKSFSIGSQDTYPYGLFFKPDGSKLYILGGSNDTIYQYSLSTAWDLSTASYDNKSFSVSSQDTYPYGLFFKPDGSKLYIVGYSSKTIYQYSLSTAWDVSTSSYDNKHFSAGSQDTSPYGLFFKPDGSKLYIVGYSSKTIYQYSLSTATVDITSQALSSAPDAVYLAPEPSTVKTCLATSADRCLCKDITLTKLSSTTTEFIGKVAYDSADFAIAGENLLASGDVVNVTVGGVELEVVVSGVSAVVTTETDITYTITFPAQSAAPTALTIPDRSEAATFSSRSWDATSGIVLTYVPQYALDARGVQYRIDGTEDCNVTKVKLDLWRS